MSLEIFSRVVDWHAAVRVMRVAIARDRDGVDASATRSPRAARVRCDGTASRVYRALVSRDAVANYPHRPGRREDLQPMSDYNGARTLVWAAVLTWETSAATPGVPAIS